MSCLFCRIAAGEIPAKKVYEDAELIAFEDINPQAPMHVLVMPRVHVATLNDLDAGARGAGRRGCCAGPRRSRTSAATPTRGYRTVFNCNADAGQTVFHLHLHVLGGRTLAWPPG